MGTPHISTTFTCSGGGGERNPSPRLGDEEVAARRRGQDRHHWGVKNQGPGRTAGGRIKASSRREPPRKLCLAGSFVKLRRKSGGVAGQAGFTRLLPAPIPCAAGGGPAARSLPFRWDLEDAHLPPPSRPCCPTDFHISSLVSPWTSCYSVHPVFPPTLPFFPFP